MLYKIKEAIKKVLPPQIISAYHFLWSFISAIYYGFPSRKIFVIAITGTKGKSSTAEYLNAILEKHGLKTALSSTIRFKIAEKSVPNKYKMTMPGRFFLQKFLKEAVDRGCDLAIIEATSEGAKQFRHKFIDFDALIFTNIYPEHIESHGSYENYKKAKLSIGKSLLNSKKRPRFLVVNIDSELADDFLKMRLEHIIPFSLKQLESLQEHEDGVEFVLDNTKIYLRQKGVMSVYNALASISMAKALGVDINTAKIALEKLRTIPGRQEKIDLGQDFELIVDYAHTPDSLEELYKAFEDKDKICVLGATGGGRDKWKRPKMASIASKYCKKVILTDEDPYDEDPKQIIEDLKAGAPDAIVIMDRREAIQKAIKFAISGIGNAVLITGKGTDPYIMRENGKREKWSDAQVAKEELSKLLKNKT